MDLGLTGKVAIVTGSARGLGAATARRLAQEGASVVVTDINAELAQATTKALQDEGLAAHCIVGDITRAADVQRLVDETVAHFGGVHILVNNAGAPRDKYLVKMSEDDWDFVMTVMLKGAFLAAKAVMPHFIEQGWGRLINISSRAYLGNPTQANYSAAKAGLIGMAKALSMEEGRYGITANCVAPGFMETEMVQALPTYETIKERAVAAQPIKRVGRPDDIADAVAFLASERAGFISGEVLHVTGGRYG
ncbi:SDR family NAD(P)-dependent oxidoreductase [Burkholderia pseudomultivorans]|uniref:3-oxoacyl-[acyl-carrier-protein] reductase FabG n=1 Tax=Burkholderia pseudomultivorans TaxID=1207504 RepID=A0A132EZ16_9BURK|nr:3-oxoacyl-ACP reductase FabG [Burkholderia pseudomultivorans]KWF36119.1 beta-ketoacyl-ACP reductase [Burkholderia pseudomultivorans]KWF64242.1 beta-ketoacyl-ACP reductase [Burkholderia pseudomultivorans]KWI47659.1 beta-ketoacyl-ACP reductase [Burkholderia pseudomultivorans]MDR8725968.1 3-oxoacyl-(acyl-carrier-protein) reductase FabG [Burkholderia pseudomultivorans]MDR8735135.1 3-oxoacyl-(acyl-carrier-protein) reductase FabG [Burkholderia pseudomultivorans]